MTTPVTVNFYVEVRHVWESYVCFVGYWNALVGLIYITNTCLHNFLSCEVQIYPQLNSNFNVLNTHENLESTNHDNTGTYLHTPAGCRIGFSFGRVYYMNLRILCSHLFKENHGVAVFTVGIPDVRPSISRLCKLFYFSSTNNNLILEISPLWLIYL